MEKLNGPFSVKLQVYVINDTTGQAGEATIGLGSCVYPTTDRIKKALKEIDFKSGPASGFRLMNKSECINYIATGSSEATLAIPGSKEWDE